MPGRDSIFLVWPVRCSSHRCSFFEVSSCGWEPMTVRREKDWQTQNKKGCWQVSFRWKRFFVCSQTLSHLHYLTRGSKVGRFQGRACRLEGQARALLHVPKHGTCSHVETNDFCKFEVVMIGCRPSSCLFCVLHDLLHSHCRQTLMFVDIRCCSHLKARDCLPSN